MKKTRGLCKTISFTLFSVLFILISCSDDLGKAPTLDIYTGYVKVDNLEKGEIVHLQSGNSRKLTYSVIPNVGSVPEDYITFEYGSSDNHVFVVKSNSELEVEARHNGQANLTITAKSNMTGNEITTNIPIEVSGQVFASDIIIDETLLTNELIIEGGQSIDLKSLYEVVPDNAYNSTVEFISFDDTKLEIKNGVMKGIASGKGYVKIRTTDGSNIEKKFYVKVDAPIKVWYTDRSKWSVSNSHPIFVDGSDSSADPLELIDGNHNSFMNMKKPGKDPSIGKDETLFFTVFTADVLKVNRLHIYHRQRGNGLARLRLWGFDLQGSNDGQTFKTLEKGVKIDGANVDNNNDNAVVVFKKAYDYKYFRFICNDYDTVNGGSIQIGEIYLGYDESKDPAALQD